MREITDNFQGYGETEERGGRTAVRVFECTWDERYTAPPQMDDAFPDNSRLLVVRRRFEPTGATGDGTKPYTHCKVTCDYSTNGLGTDSTIPLVSGETSGDVLQILGGRRFADDNTPVDQPLTVCESYHRRAFERTVLTPNWTAIYACWNKVNASVWQPAGETIVYAAGTVRFDGVSERQEYDDANGYRTRLVYNTLIRPGHGHNEVLRSDTGVWTAVTPPLYAAADMSQWTAMVL
jgi:hypothetical protein